MSRPEPTFPIREWLLDVKRYGIQEAVSPWLLETLEAEALRDVTFNHLIVKLQAQILTRDVDGYDVEAREQVPASWWDHYKHTLWTSVVDKPGWGARFDRWTFRQLRLDRIRWRTFTATVHVQEFLAYPDADPAMARVLGRGVPKRIVTGPVSGWDLLAALYPPDSRGDTDSHD